MVLARATGRLDERASPPAAAGRSLARGMAVVLPVAALHRAGNLSRLFVRYVRSVMLVATIPGTTRHDSSIQSVYGGAVVALFDHPGRDRGLGLDDRVSGGRALPAVSPE